MDAALLGSFVRTAEALGDVLGTPVAYVQDGKPLLQQGKGWSGFPALPEDQGTEAVPAPHCYHMIGQNEWLFMRVLDGVAGKGHVVAGPFPLGSAWVNGCTVLPGAFDAKLNVVDIEVPRQALTAAYLYAVSSSLFAVAHQEPASLDLMTDDIGVENIRRIGATLADQLGVLGPGTALATVAHSFARIRPLRDFVDELSAGSTPEHLTGIFRKLTARLPVGFHLMDLLAQPLIKPTKYSAVCREVFRRSMPLRCLLSDLTQLWGACLRHRAARDREKVYRYRCHAQYTEMLCPILAEDLVAGAVFGGQVVESDEQWQTIVERAQSCAVDIRGSVALDHGSISEPASINTVGEACVGLAGLTGMVFDQWCRAESESELRRELIEASQAPTLEEFAAKVCAAIQRCTAVTACSLWLHRVPQDDLVLLGTTARVFYVRQHPQSQAQQAESSGLIGKATYQLGEGLTGKAAQSWSPLYVQHAARAPAWSGKFSETHPDRDTALVVLPLVREGRLWGVLRYCKADPWGRITDTDRRLFDAIAGEIAISVREKTLAEQAKVQAERFKFIMKVGAHEFRSPLQIILSQLTVLSHLVARENAAIRDIAKLVEEQALRAKRQLDNALTFDNKVAYNFRIASLGSLFHAAEREFKSRSSHRNVSIVVWDSAKRLPSIRMDSERMGQVITNLLDNAWKYSFRGERINVRGWEGESTVGFSVENRGIGIPEWSAQTIFEPFNRKVVEDATRFIPGTGLGLPIVKQIVGAHGGKVAYTSVPFLSDPRRQGPEHGHIVVFTVELPKGTKES